MRDSLVELFQEFFMQLDDCVDRVLDELALVRRTRR